MKYRNNKFSISLAKPEDAAQLLRIYECDDFRGNISVLYTRRPDPFKSLMLEGEKVIIPIITDIENDMIVGMGVCIIRKAYINGEIVNTGYLTGLKGLPEYRKRVPSISEVYRYLHDVTKDDVDIYYTTILKENVSVQKMLAKKRKNMPEYRSMGEYTVYCFKTGTARKEDVYTLEMGNKRDLERQFHSDPGSFNFSPVHVGLHGLGEEDIYLLRNQSGQVLASCAVWNQQSYKQYVVTEYKGIYSYIKRFPLQLLGYPNLPQENIPANYGSIALLNVKDNDELLAECFLKKVAQKAGNYDFLMLGLFENHPFTSSMDRIKCIKYQSRLYTVYWDNNSLELDDRPVNLEVGLL
jgi:hypothetical protein